MPRSVSIPHTHRIGDSDRARTRRGVPRLYPPPSHTGLVIPTGLEPVTYRLEICCTIHCATGPFEFLRKNKYFSVVNLIKNLEIYILVKFKPQKN